MGASGCVVRAALPRRAPSCPSPCITAFNSTAGNGYALLIHLPPDLHCSVHLPAGVANALDMLDTAAARFVRWATQESALLHSPLQASQMALLGSCNRKGLGIFAVITPSWRTHTIIPTPPLFTQTGQFIFASSIVCTGGRKAGFWCPSPVPHTMIFTRPLLNYPQTTLLLALEGVEC